MSEDYTSIVNERHYHRLQSLLDEARAKGAKVIEVGEKPETAAGRPHTMAPTVVVDATRDMGLLSEEIFGPILPVVPYEGIESAISYVNSAPRHLALYYFGRNNEDRQKVLERTTSGNVTINDTMLHFAQDDLPFGGVGPSGMGAYHGIEGFKSLSHAKGIFEQSNLNFGWTLHPPYGRIFGFITQFLLR
ncbi:MAG: aldehyde dehydrogenase family protein [Hyphomicrobium sp.]|uniref:aldehyde dehydrogenase family protein n=1 Tax=Hyphomicrobium sp. TaxID=82 RepID=UPI0039E602A1